VIIELEVLRNLFPFLEKLKDAYAVYLGYRPSSFWPYAKETLLKGALAWVPGIVGVFLRNLTYGLILGKIGPFCMIMKDVDLRGCPGIFLSSKVKLRMHASIRRSYARNRVILGNNASVHEYAVIKSRGGDIAIGDNTFVSSFVNIAAKGKVAIGRNVMLANGCRLETGTHGFDDIKLPIKQQEASSLGIVIEDDCWLGAGVVVVDNVRIGRGSVIGAGSVVTKNVPPYSIAVGVPARVLKTRTEGEVVFEDPGPL
jgi:acetyltransferase-like isoleucine patch superfamily enzyme